MSILILIQLFGTPFIATADQSALIELGKTLYFENRLSVDNSISCNSCHNILSRGNGADTTKSSLGFGGHQTPRNSPTVWDAKFYSVLMWDGKVSHLAEQAGLPILEPFEMGFDSKEAVVTKIQKIKGYKKLFKKAFPKTKSPINFSNIKSAIGAFGETLVTGPSAFDRFLAGDKSAITPQQIRGVKRFQEVGCTSCHSGKYFSGPEMIKGTGFYMKFPMFPKPEIEAKYKISRDTGRMKVTKIPIDKNSWRVSSLRNVAVTPPYFHNGSAKTLKESVKVMALTQLNVTLSEQDADDITAFLRSLTGEIPKIEKPILPQ